MENFQEASAKVATPGQSGKAEDLGGEDGKSKELKLKSNATAKGKAKPGSKESSATPVKDPSSKQEKMYNGEEVEVEEVQEPKPSTKLGMIKQIQDRVTSMKKAEVEEVLTTFKAKEEEELKSKKQEEEDGDEEEVTNEGELPPALKKAIDAKKKDSDDDDEEEVKVKKDPKAEKITAEDLKLDISTDASALFEKADVDLSEEFKKDAMVIFEAAVATRVVDLVNGKIDELNEDFNVALEEEKAEIDTKLSEKIDDYLTYVSEEWMKENELAVERGIRAELAENFIGGLRELFKEHYIEVPEERTDVIEELFAKVEGLEEQLNVEMQANIATLKTLKEYKKVEAIAEACSGLTSVEQDKMVELAESIAYESNEQFISKMQVIKESYFKNRDSDSVEDTRQELTEAMSSSEELDEEPNDVSGDPQMERYTSAIRRVQRIVT
tara:strand:- start:291 stop:1610 length:1320 start_codon:yes stop_codon:yes gene_type:complete